MPGQGNIGALTAAGETGVGRNGTGDQQDNNDDDLSTPDECFRNHQENQGAMQGESQRQMLTTDFVKIKLFRQMKFRLLKKGSVKKDNDALLRRAVLVNALSWRKDKVDDALAKKTWGLLRPNVEKALRIRKNSVVDAMKKKVLGEFCVCLNWVHCAAFWLQLAQLLFTNLLL